MTAQPDSHMVETDSCPVCCGAVDKRESVKNNMTVYFFGHRYYLMCRQCKGDFLREPDSYTNHGRDPESRWELSGTTMSELHTQRECCK